MTENWSGLYLKADRESVADAVLVLATARGQQIHTHIDSVNQVSLDEVLGEFNYSELGKVIDVVLLLTLDNGWTSVIGRDLLDACFPRMFYSSELALLLSCDAFECGF